jgi:hypothetical protein
MIIITMVIVTIIVIIIIIIIIIEKIKTLNLIWRIKLKTIKTLTKWPRKIIRNQKKRDQIEITIIIEKNNHKLDLNQIASHKNFDKIAKKTNLEIKSKKNQIEIPYIYKLRIKS